MGRGRYTMGRRVNIPWLGDTIPWVRGIKIPWVSGSICHGQGVGIPWVGGKRPWICGRHTMGRRVDMP